MSTWVRALSWPEKLALGALLVAVGAAATKTNPMLQHLHGFHVEDVVGAPADRLSGIDVGNIRVERAKTTGCVEIRTRQGVTTGPICNGDLWCQNSSDPPSPYWSLQLYRLKTPNAYYVETSSECNSACCDTAGMSLTGEGARLDDGIWQRIALRLGPIGAVGVVMVLLGWSLARGPHRSLSSRILVLAGCLVDMTMLWWHR